MSLYRAIRCVYLSLFYFNLALLVPAYAGSLEPVDLTSHNPASVLQNPKRMALFSRVYRGETRHWSEAKAVQALLDRQGVALRSKLIWKKLAPFLEKHCAGDDPNVIAVCEQPFLENAIAEAKKELKRRPLRDLLRNTGNDSDSRDFFLYTTPHRKIAEHYGLYVFHIETKPLRGVDVSRFNAAQGTTPKLSLDPKEFFEFLRNTYADLDEFALPLFIPNADINAVDIHKAGSMKAPHDNGYYFPGSIKRRYIWTVDGAEIWIPTLPLGRLVRYGKLIILPLGEGNCPPEFPVAVPFALGDEDFDSLPAQIGIGEASLALCRSEETHK